MGLDAISATNDATEKTPLEQALHDQILSMHARRHEIMQRADENVSDANQTIRDFAEVNSLYGQLIGIQMVQEVAGLSKNTVADSNQAIIGFGIAKDALNDRIRKLEEGKQ